MEVTPLGLIVIPLSIILFLLAPRGLFWGVIICLPLWQAVILRVPSITFEADPALYFMLLLLLRRALDYLLIKRITIPRTRAYMLLAIFLVAVAVSLIMPLLIAGGSSAQPVDGPYLPFAPQPIYFSRVNITQTLYIFFWALSSLILTKEMYHLKRLKRVIKLVIIMGVITVLTGLVNQVFRLLEMDTLAYNMYAILGGRDLSFLRKEVAGLPLMYSIAGEPGWTSSFLLLVLGLIGVPSFLGSTNLVWSRRVNVAVLLFIILGLLLGGTTGYIGLVIFFTSGLVFLKLRLPTLHFINVTKRWIAIGILSTTLLVLIFRMIGVSLVTYLEKAHSAKLLLESGSGPTRLLYAIENVKLFMQYPILGVGFGSSKSSSLITGLLSNIGLLGILPFLWFNWALLRENLRVYLHAGDREFMILSLALSLSFLAFFGASLIAKSMGTLTHPWYWLLLTMLAVLPRLYYHFRASGYCQKSHEKNEEEGGV